MASMRRTRQLNAVYETVRAAQDHPSADDVLARVRRRLPHVSLGTVYRNLQKLVTQRQLRVVQLSNRAARYDAEMAEHDHFVCEACGAVTDLKPRSAGFAARRLDETGFRVRSYTLTFYGQCPDCYAASDPHGSEHHR